MMSRICFSNFKSKFAIFTAFAAFVTSYGEAATHLVIGCGGNLRQRQAALGEYQKTFRETPRIKELPTYLVIKDYERYTRTVGQEVTVGYSAKFTVRRERSIPSRRFDGSGHDAPKLFKEILQNGKDKFTIAPPGYERFIFEWCDKESCGTPTTIGPVYESGTARYIVNEPSGQVDQILTQWDHCSFTKVYAP